jgi:predicted nucleic acid-binding protein
MSVFVDTSALLAIINSEDERHDTAAAEWTSLVLSAERPITSNYVILELMAILQHRYGMGAVHRVTDEILPALDLHYVDRSIHEAAIEMLRESWDQRGLSLVDCTSILIMRRAGITEIFAYDERFEDWGFDLVGQ